MHVTGPLVAEAGLWEAYFAGLAVFHQRLGRRLAIVVIPDEFQVNDELWVEPLSAQADPSVFDRTLPQRKIAEFCADRGVPCLDLLPLLRAAQVEGRTYHLRDTHWNARGNAIAGAAIAEFVAGLVERFGE